MKFVVYDRKKISQVPPPESSWAVISICEQGDFPSVFENDHLVGRLNLKFHDIDRVDPKELRDRILFNDAMAMQVLDFYQSLKDQDCKVVFIHCAMGMCRSPAISAALQKIETGDDHIWFATKRPNMLVYRTIMEVANERGLIG